MLKRLVSWIAVFLWMGVIFWLSGKPRVIPMMSPLLAYTISTLGHLLFYGILYFLVYRALHISSGLARRQVILLSLLVVLLYGISDEYHQSFIPGREASIIDVGFDLLGGVIAAKLHKNTRTLGH